MENRDVRRASRQKILNRLNADEELFSMPKVKPNPEEEERQRKLEGEIAEAEEWAMRSSAFAGGCF